MKTDIKKRFLLMLSICLRPQLDSIPSPNRCPASYSAPEPAQNRSRKCPSAPSGSDALPALADQDRNDLGHLIQSALPKCTVLLGGQRSSLCSHTGLP